MKPQYCVIGATGKKGLKGWTGPNQSLSGPTGSQGPDGPPAGGPSNFRSHVWAARLNVAPIAWPVLADVGPIDRILGDQINSVGQSPQINFSGDITSTGGTDVMRMTIGTTGNYKVSMGMIFSLIQYGPFFMDVDDNADFHLVLAKNLVTATSYVNVLEALYIANYFGRNVTLQKESIINLTAGDTLTLVLRVDNYVALDPLPGDGLVAFDTAFLNTQFLS